MYLLPYWSGLFKHDRNRTASLCTLLHALINYSGLFFADWTQFYCLHLSIFSTYIILTDSQNKNILEITNDLFRFWYDLERQYKIWLVHQKTWVPKSDTITKCTKYILSLLQQFLVSMQVVWYLGQSPWKKIIPVGLFREKIVCTILNSKCLSDDLVKNVIHNTYIRY